MELSWLRMLIGEILKKVHRLRQPQLDWTVKTESIKIYNLVSLVVVMSTTRRLFMIARLKDQLLVHKQIGKMKDHLVALTMEFKTWILTA